MWIDYQLHIYFIYIFIYFSSLARSLSCYCALAHLSHLLSFIFVYNVTKMVTGLKLQSPKTNSENRGREGERRVRPRGGWGGEDCCCSLPITDSCNTEDTVCLMLGHQRGGGGGSFPVELLSLSWRFSSATSKGMISTQPMAPKSAKSRRSSSSEEELSSCISVDRSSSWTNRLRSARSPSRNCRSASDILGSFNRANRNWELWDEDEGLLSPTEAVLAVAVLGGGMALPALPGLLLRRVAWRPVSTCCRAA